MRGFHTHYPDQCPHNVGNDIAYATTVTLLMGLRDKIYPHADGTGYSTTEEFNGVCIIDIIHDYMDYCKHLDPPTGGHASFCYNCESADHQKNFCNAPDIKCDNCKNAGGPANRKYRQKVKSHNTKLCSWYFEFTYKHLPDWVREKLVKKQQEFEVAKTVNFLIS